MNNLSIFVDESGDFGQYRPHSPYYIVAMVLHEQSKNLSSEITKLNIELENLGYTNPVIHTEPLIRREDDYLNMTPEKRRSIFTLNDYDIRKAIPCDYKLFQAADLICTLELLRLKSQTGSLTRSETLIFHSKRALKKDFLKVLSKKEFRP